MPRKARRIIILFLELPEFIFHHGNLYGIGRVIIKIMQLMRVIFMFIKFPAFIVFIEMNQLLPVIAHPVMALHHMLGRIFIEMIIKRLAPSFRLLPLQQRHK